MELTIDDLAVTYRETFTARSSWYNIGLALEVPVATLDDIDGCSRDPKDLLREVLKAWLRRARKPTWQSLVDALDNPIVDEPKLARVLQEKYCAEPINPTQLLREQVVADTQATAALKEAYLQQEHTLQDLQGTAAARSFQIQEFEEQVSEKKTNLQDTVTAQGLQIHEMVEKVREKKAQQQEVATFNPSGATVAEGERMTLIQKLRQMMTRGHAVVDGCMVYFLPCHNLIDGDWCEQFHPMPTKRAETAAICTEKVLVVAGGENASGMKNTVEVMDTETLQWSTASSLPHPLREASATVCGDCLYLTGDDRHYSIFTGIMLTCSLSNLVQSYQPHAQSLTARIRSIFTRRTTAWQRVADIPVRHTTFATFNGHLLAVGGATSLHQTTNNIYTLNPITNSWEVTSHMPTARSHCLVAVLPRNKLMVIGGYTKYLLDPSNAVEIVDNTECTV